MTTASARSAALSNLLVHNLVAEFQDLPDGKQQLLDAAASTGGREGKPATPWVGECYRKAADLLGDAGR